MKGFFFSLDSLVASSVMLAVFALLLSQPADVNTKPDSYKLDRVYTSSMQEMNSWNQTYNTSLKVSSYITDRVLEGDAQKAIEVCRRYFNVTEEYGVFISNESRQMKICGNVNVASAENLLSETAFASSVKANDSLWGPNQLTMVIKD